MKTFSVMLVCLFIFSGLAGAQNQPRSGGFAAVPVPPQPATRAAATPQPPRVTRPTTPAQTATPQQQEQMRIVADPATNSLIIYGTAQEFQNIKNILKDLDAVPRQVLLDVLIAEITHSDSESLGVDYEVLQRDPKSIFGARFGSAGAVRTLGSLFPNVADDGTGTFGQGLTGVFGGSDIKALVHALQQNARVKILSSPSILATDNRPARIQVGSEEPIATGSLSATGSTTPLSTSTTIQYRNTGRIVTIIPQVNSQGLVNLQIVAEVSQRGNNVPVGGTGESFPSFDTRQAETTAVVQDGDTLAIGGIIGENVIQDRSGIPYLMDIPVVGRFFATTRDEVRRTELVMLITPHVIRNRDEANSVTYDFKNSLATIRNELERIKLEQEKLVPKTLPQPLPPVPEPDSVEPTPPQPAPTSVVPGQSGTWIPISGPAAGLPISLDRAEAGTAVPLKGRVEPPGANIPTPEINREVVTPKPQGFALSLAPVPVAAAKPSVAKISDKQSRIWAVQVAAMAENKDAESLAAKLRKVGHQAYVVTRQVANKIWHRVRIGEFENQSDARELKKAIAAKTEFRKAYVALN